MTNEEIYQKGYKEGFESSKEYLDSLNGELPDEETFLTIIDDLHDNKYESFIEEIENTEEDYLYKLNNYGNGCEEGSYDCLQEYIIKNSKTLCPYCKSKFTKINVIFETEYLCITLNSESSDNNLYFNIYIPEGWTFNSEHLNKICKNGTIFCRECCQSNIIKNNILDYIKINKVE